MFTKDDKVYISGAITHNPDFAKTFNDMEEHLKREFGCDVYNPATETPQDWPYHRQMRYDLNLILGGAITSMLMLYGWEKSFGAHAEYMVAVSIGLRIVQESEMWDEWRARAEDVVRTTDGETPPVADVEQCECGKGCGE